VQIKPKGGRLGYNRLALSSPIQNRAANASLLGYHYQLDKALIEIFQCKTADAVVVIEGVEDIDVISTGSHAAIQCKYYEAQSGTPSALREPIQLMLSEFKKDETKPWSFRLYVFFGKGNGLTALDLTTLKGLLTYKKAKQEHKFFEDENLSDATLKAFLSCLSIIPGPSHADQQKFLFKLIQVQLNATAVEVANFLYTKALSLALRTATQKTLAHRTIQPKLFLKEIEEAATTVMSPWLLRLLGREKTLLFVNRSLKGLPLLKHSSTKTIFLDAEETVTAGIVKLSLADFIEYLALNVFTEKKSLYSGKPWTVIVDLDSQSMDELKQTLLQRGIVYNDGFEDFGFFPQLFQNDPVVNRTVTKGKPSDKLGRVSYKVRLARLESVLNHVPTIAWGEVVLCTNNVEQSPKIAAHCSPCINIGGFWTRAEILKILTR
jgi:hypothetical protein